MSPKPPSEYVIDFPVMWVALEWIEQHCVIPDGFHKGKPFMLSEYQGWYFANFYGVKPNAPLPTEQRPAVGAPAFKYRRAQVVMPQKAGKGPMTAAHVALEGVGPALFAGWARGGETWDCRDHGCGCGWVYEYEPGEPMGAQWPTPLIQITAFSEEQTGNVYDALRPMIELGPLSAVVPRTGEAFIRLPGGGRIDTVTSSQQSRLGQRVTFVPQDETGIWTDTNKMTNVAKTQRRGAAAMQGRTAETTNAWDPSENSVAQRTYLAALRTDDIFRLHRLASPHLSFGNKVERRRILRYLYADCWWIDIDSIEAEAFELLGEDPANAERFYGNRIVPGLGAWMPDEVRRLAARPGELVPEGIMVAGGFDGSESDDWTAIRLETVAGHRFTPRYGPDRRLAYWNPAEWGGTIPRGEVHAAMDEINRRYVVRRFYCDPRDWQSEIGDWALRYGEEVYLEWATYRIQAMYDALVRSLTDYRTVRSTHDDEPMFVEHLANTRKIAKPGDKYILGKPAKHQKIDLAMADTLAHEAAADLHAEAAWSPAGSLTRMRGRTYSKP